MTNSSKIYKDIFTEMVIPAYTDIIKKENEKAIQLYYDYFLRLCKEYVKSPQ